MKGSTRTNRVIARLALPALAAMSAAALAKDGTLQIVSINDVSEVRVFDTKKKEVDSGPPLEYQWLVGFEVVKRDNFYEVSLDNGVLWLLAKDVKARVKGTVPVICSDLPPSSDTSGASGLGDKYCD